MRFQIRDPIRRRVLLERHCSRRWNDAKLAELARNNGVSVDFVIANLQVARER
jgi:hypothetical protein